MVMRGFVVMSVLLIPIVFRIFVSASCLDKKMCWRRLHLSGSACYRKEKDL